MNDTPVSLKSRTQTHTCIPTESRTRSCTICLACFGCRPWMNVTSGVLVALRDARFFVDEKCKLCCVRLETARPWISACAIWVPERPISFSYRACAGDVTHPTQIPDPSAFTDLPPSSHLPLVHPPPASKLSRNERSRARNVSSHFSSGRGKQPAIDEECDFECGCVRESGCLGLWL